MLKVIDLDPADEDTDGVAVDLTGAGPWDVADFELEALPDGLAHQLSLSSTANLSGITITITGTDADGNTISEARAGPNNNTVETTKFFKTVTDVAAGATLGANTMDVGWVDEVVSQTIELDWRRDVPSYYFLDVTGTINLDVDHAVEDVGIVTDQHSIRWFNVSSSLLAETADSAAAVQITAGYTAARININSYSSGAEVQVFIVQPEVV